jgi:hypothetical protein
MALQSFARLLLATLPIAWIALPAEARPLQIFTYQQLLDRSDLVVIASPATRTKDTGEESIFPNTRINYSDGKTTPATCNGVETSFTVSAVLKGDPSLRSFTLRHCRAGNPNVANGPVLVFFDPADRQASGSYLLFLVRESDGRYAPAGGQTDPGINAISKLPFADIVSRPR